MVLAVRRGLSLRATARRFHKSDSTVRRWVLRAGHQRLARVDWLDGSSGNPFPRKTSAAQENLILRLRERLRHHSALGECGAAAIHRALLSSAQPAPSVRTIARILARRGVVRAQRVRRPAPPPGWYLPKLFCAEAELDSFDFVEGLAFEGRSHFDALTAMSLWGSLSGTWILRNGTSLATTREAITQHWRTWGLPDYGQFDNDAIFQGSHGHPAHLGRLVHFCLCLGVVPVFTPPREQGFQNKLESFNAYWQQKVWQRRRYRSHTDLSRANEAFLIAHHTKQAARQEVAPPRLPFPSQIPRQIAADRVIFLRRADELGRVLLTNRSFTLPTGHSHRLLRCEWHIPSAFLRVFALHRRHPAQQPLLLSLPWKISLTPWFSTPR